MDWELYTTTRPGPARPGPVLTRPAQAGPHTTDRLGSAHGSLSSLTPNGNLAACL
jgi:hypothetical protein